jgi:hypothetical protein
MWWIRNWDTDWHDLVLTFAVWAAEGAQRAAALGIRRAYLMACDRAEITFLCS